MTLKTLTGHAPGLGLECDEGVRQSRVLEKVEEHGHHVIPPVRRELGSGMAVVAGPRVFALTARRGVPTNTRIAGRSELAIVRLDQRTTRHTRVSLRRKPGRAPRADTAASITYSAASARLHRGGCRTSTRGDRADAPPTLACSFPESRLSFEGIPSNPPRSSARVVTRGALPSRRIVVASQAPLRRSSRVAVATPPPVGSVAPPRSRESPRA